MKRLTLILTTLACLALACSISPIKTESPPIDEPTLPPLAPTDTPVPAAPTPTDEIIIESFLPPPDEGKILHFRFNGNLDDEAQNVTPQFTNITYDVGRFDLGDGAVRFNGVDSLILLPDADDLDLTGSFTIAFFIQGNAQSDHEWLIMTKHQAGVCQPPDTAWMIRYQPEMGLRFVNYDESVDCGKVILAAPDVNLLDDRWHHVAFVYGQAANSMRLYFDLVVVAEVFDTALHIQNNDIPLIIGNQYQGSPQYALDAALDDLFIYNVAATESDISLIHEAGGR